MQAIIGIFFSALAILLSQFQQPKSLQEVRHLVPPPPHLEYFSFGFQMSIADGLWIRAIQDFDFCEQSLAVHLCKGNGWLSQMLDSITNLAPDYLVAYNNGGLALTVLVSDYEGASKIFDKGVKAFPKDKALLYTAAYHAMMEEKNKAKAAELLIQAAKAGGNEWYYSLAGKLYAEAGEKELAQGLYENLQKDPNANQKVLERLKERIEKSK